MNIHNLLKAIITNIEAQFPNTLGHQNPVISDIQKYLIEVYALCQQAKDDEDIDEHLNTIYHMLRSLALCIQTKLIIASAQNILQDDILEALVSLAENIFLVKCRMSFDDELDQIQCFRNGLTQALTYEEYKTGISITVTPQRSGAILKTGATTEDYANRLMAARQHLDPNYQPTTSPIFANIMSRVGIFAETSSPDAIEDPLNFNLS